MGKLSDYKSQNPSVFKSQSTQSSPSSSQETLNLPIKITGYEINGSPETNFILGKRIDTKEDVRVKLSDIEQDSSRKFKRVEVSEFADPKNRKRHVSVGCPMVFEGSKQNPDGSFSSRWAVVLDRDPNGTNVMVMNSSLVHGEKKTDNGKQEWFKIQALIPIQPKEVSTKEEFESLLANHLTPKFNGSNPQSFIRITDDEGDIHVIEVRPLRVDVTEDNKTFKRVTANGEDSVREFEKTNPEQYKMVIDFTEQSDIKVELIQNAILYPGAATKENMEGMNERSKQILIESYYTKEKELLEGEEKPRFPSVGYIPSVLATRMYPDGTPYLTYIRPLKFFDEALLIDNIEKITIR